MLEDVVVVYLKVLSLHLPIRTEDHENPQHCWSPVRDSNRGSYKYEL
jgi:hypothetical protein